MALWLILFVIFVCSSVTLGTYSYFSYVQMRLTVGVPWYYPFFIDITSITLAFVVSLVVLYCIHMLLPIVVIIATFLLFVLWLTGLVKSSIELWGPLGSVNDNCVRFVYEAGFWRGATLDTLARIQQEGMCNLWKTAFAMEMIATLLLVWLFVMAWQVMADARRVVVRESVRDII